jgi:arsenate reductase (thioredoxin)
LLWTNLLFVGQAHDFKRPNPRILHISGCGGFEQDCEMALVAAGVKPNTHLGVEADLTTGDDYRRFRKDGDNMQKVIFACVHNAGRSQMSAAFFNQFADPKRALAISAGTQPAEHVHPVVVEAMLEVGIDLRNAKPQRLTAELAQNAEILVTMGCGDECPYVPGLRRDDWPLPDPKGQGIESVRQTRDEIKRRVLQLLVQERLSNVVSG